MSRLRRATWGIGGLLVLAGGLGAAVVWWRTSGPAPQPRRGEPQPARAEAAEHGESRFAGFVGDRVCGECHADLLASYHRTGMARSWRSVESTPPLGLDQPNVVDSPSSGYRYTVLSEGGRVYQEEQLAGGPSDEPHRLHRAARYTVGSGTHAQTMIAETNGYLHQMPIAWFSGPEEWRLNPGYELFNHRFGRPVPPGCVSCHGTSADHIEPTRCRYVQPVPEGISCERCHGPGAAHARHWRGGGHAESRGAQAVAESDATILNPGRMAPDRANDVCLQCHLQGDVTLFAPGSNPFSFRPGDRLRDHRLDFLIRTEQPESFGVASHGARLLRSRCFTESGGKLTCIHCHDPHVPVQEVSREHFDARCVACHRPQDCDRTAPAAEKQQAQGCTACHMPQRETRESLHLVFTDHWIRARPAPQPEPEPLPPDAQVELVSAWPGETPAAVRLGSAYVLLHETMGPQRPALARGVELLSQARAAGRLDAEGAYWLGSALIGLRRGTDAITVLQPLLRGDPHNAKARFRLGIAYDQMRDYEAAIRQYERVIHDAPDWLEPYPLLVRLHLFRREPERAIRLLEQQLGYHPDATAYAHLATARWMSGVPPRDCLKLTDRALALDPRSLDALLIRAHLLVQAGETPRAMATYRQILTIQPDHGIARAQLEALMNDDDRDR